MVHRRTQLLDAGIEVVADHGIGGLTLDSVDARAHVPAGSTAALFPTHQALVEGVTERCIEREMEMATGPHRAVTLARYVLHAEAARTPSLRAFYAVGADEVDTWALDLVRRAGSRHPERDFGIVANYVTGLVLHELALPTADLDVAGRVRTLIDALQWSQP